MNDSGVAFVNYFNWYWMNNDCIDPNESIFVLQIICTHKNVGGNQWGFKKEHVKVD